MKDLDRETVYFILIKFKGIIFCDCCVLSAVARERSITHSIDKKQGTIYAISDSEWKLPADALKCPI